MKFFKISFLLLFMVFAPSFAIAQEGKEQGDVLNYAPVTHKDIMTLMWKYKIHDYSNPNIMDQYLQIMNCPLYKKYKSDDFVWEKIREGMRREINYFSSSFPDRFEIYAFMPIERYDFQKNVFVIPNRFALSNAGSIQIPFFEIDNNSSDTCFVTNERRKNFPTDVKFLADNKFSLIDIPVAPDKANQILEGIKKYNYKNTEFNRIFAVRFRIKVNGIDNYKVDFSNSELLLKGELDEIAFFEDPQRTKLIWKKEFKKLQ